MTRVYTEGTATQIANWYGKYCQPLSSGGCNPHAGFSTVGSTNANRYQVSGSPIIVYTGSSNPVYRMLLTSYDSDSAAARILEMNAHTGTMSVYTPQHPMGIE